MSERVVWLALSVVLSLTGSLAGQVWPSGVVLLDNDQIMTGRIELQGDHYFIKKSEGHEVRLPRKQVVAITNDLQELYQFKVRQLPQFPRSADHARLARWCLKAKLLEQAGEQYLSAVQLLHGYPSPSLKQLGIEISQTMLGQPDFRIAMGLPPLPALTQSAALDPGNRAINQAAALSTLPKSRTAVATASASGAVGSTDLGGRNLSGQAYSRFNERVQLILLNRCGQAACHGSPNASGWHLSELRGSNGSEATRNNLEMALALISNDSQSQSRLVEYLTKQHGNQRSPAMGARDLALMGEIEQWVALVKNPVVTADGWGSNSPASLNPVPAGAPELRKVPSGQANSLSPDGFPVGADIPSLAEIDELEKQIRAVTEQSSSSRASGDPFDPAQFNRGWTTPGQR